MNFWAGSGEKPTQPAVPTAFSEFVRWAVLLWIYKTGIPTINPPIITPPYQDNPANGPIYPSFVPKTDGDGNDLAGIRLPEVQVPLATYTGWALRAAPQDNDGCEGSGQYIPFART